MSKTGGKLGSTGIRNVFRPFFNVSRFKGQRYGAKPRQVFYKEMQAVRRDVSTEDLKILCEVVEDKVYFPFTGLGNNFVGNKGDVFNRSFHKLEPLKPEKELEIAIARLNHYEDRLIPALDSVAAINETIKRGDSVEFESLLGQHKALYGHSIIILKKELYVEAVVGGLKGLVRKYRLSTKGYSSKPYGVYARYIYDMADPTDDPLRSARRWEQLIGESAASYEWMTAVMLESLLSSAQSKAAMASAILRINSTSLLDTCFLVWRILSTSFYRDDYLLQSKKLNVGIFSALQNSFSNYNLRVADRYIISSNGPSDKSIYRTSFFFDEYTNIAEWRATFNSLIFPKRLSGERFRHAMAEKIAGVAADLSTASDLNRDCQAWFSSILLSTGELIDTAILTTLVVARAIDEIDEDSATHSAKLIEVISKIDDLYYYLSSDRLHELSSSHACQASPLLKFMVSTLIFRRNRTPDNELERRLAFMDIFMSGARSDILPYIKSVSEWSQSVALMLAHTCTRPLLERLYLLMMNVKDVLETRLQICEWIIETDQESETNVFREEHDALVRELANLDARSDLDSTRIHVDEDSLREWFSETQQSAKARYVQAVLAEGSTSVNPNLLTYYTRLAKEQAESDDIEEKPLVDTQIGSEVSFLEIVDATLVVFATDRFFGLNSYLSRRIRHGTLSGHLLTPVNRIIRRFEESYRAEGSANTDKIVGMLTQWAKVLQDEIDMARRDVIQIRSPKAPDGLIRATWRNSANVVHLDAMIARVRGRVYETNGTYDFFSDLHSLCWDCIETDLAQLRVYMLRQSYPKMASLLNTSYEKLSNSEQADAFPACAELLHTLNLRVQEVCGWFIRPVFRRDAYNLLMLVNSTYSIVKELDDAFEFQGSCSIGSDVSINRGAFELIGDVMFILIGNAAKHGDRLGRIEVSGYPSADDKSFISTTVTSYCPSDAEFDLAVERILAATSSYDVHMLATAAVEEGFSGLRKLIGRLQRVKGASMAFRYVRSERRISFETIIPSVVTFRRERA